MAVGIGHRGGGVARPAAEAANLKRVGSCGVMAAASAYG